jgi:hypothetical protein
MNNKIIELNNHKPVATVAEHSNTCINCIHFEVNPDNTDIGMCMANPPQIVVVPQQDVLRGGMSLSLQSHFPTVSCRTHCGIFEFLIDDIDEEHEQG